VENNDSNQDWLGTNVVITQSKRILFVVVLHIQGPSEAAQRARDALWQCAVGGRRLAPGWETAASHHDAMLRRLQ
jgi:hypothetical protein